MAPIIALLMLALALSPARAAETLRIGVQKTGTFAWQLDVVRRHGLAAAQGLDLQTSDYASPDAAKLQINSGAVDIVVTDWLWVARERALGVRLQFYPYSRSAGAVYAKADSPVKTLADLKGRTLAVAGGALDKSWLILRAAALREKIDLQREATLQFGAPPLIFQKTQQADVDAGLNYWNFGARLEAQGFRAVLDIAEAERRLGLAEPVALIGYAFDEAFAAKRRAALDAFLAAVRQADDLLLSSDAEWDALRPLMGAPDDATFRATRDRVRQGLPRRPIEAEERDAKTLFETLAAIGGTDLVGPSKTLDPGLYYRPAARGL